MRTLTQSGVQNPKENASYAIVSVSGSIEFISSDLHYYLSDSHITLFSPHSPFIHCFIPFLFVSLLLFINHSWSAHILQGPKGWAGAI